MGDTQQQLWRFKALDTWFFRESRPMESVGGSELLSAFPPSPRTLAGAIRSVVGEHHRVDWRQWKDKAQQSPLKQRIGDADGLGKLTVSGPWLACENAAGEVERLFPVPRNLVALREGNAIKRTLRMQVGKPRYCDLGKAVRMAVAPLLEAKTAALEDEWINATTLYQVLMGGICQPDALVTTRNLFAREARLGIARNNMSRSVETGLLYQTRHVRPMQNVILEMGVTGLLADDHPMQGVVRFGGEGRGAAYSVQPLTDTCFPAKVQVNSHTHGILLMLLTPAGMANASSETAYAPLPGFQCTEQSGATVWRGQLQGIPLTLHCAIQGKPVREGGWDLANNQPRAVQSLIPAGSVYYLTVDNGDIPAAIDALHLTQLPAEQDELALGRGLLAVGLWPDNELMGKE